MRILILQHNSVQHPGIFRQFLSEDGHDWLSIQIDESERIPPLDGFDALWVMGGMIEEWGKEPFPLFRDEIELIRQAVEVQGMPFLGICLGHQLLATALGGGCARLKQPDIGVLPVQLTEEGATAIIFDDVPEDFKSMQWHNSEVTKMPAGSVCLATSPNCSVQAMSWGPRAYSLQFHLEIDSEIMANWMAITDCKQQLDATLGKDGTSIMLEACKDQMALFNKLAERVYINWLHAGAQV